MMKPMARFARGNRGSSVVMALAFGIVLLIVIAGLRSYSSYRIASSIKEWNNLKAGSLAEAGIAAVLTQLSQNYSFVTHTLNTDLTWGGGQPYTVVNVTGPLSVSNSGGNLTGALAGLDGSFQARCGLIQYSDNTSTENVDEAKGYLLVVSIGKYANTYRKIVSVINRRFPSKECLLYDGDVLSVVYGAKSGGADDTNIFSLGNLYGHRGVEISQILNTRLTGSGQGTKQRVTDFSLIASGKGGIILSSQVAFKPRSGSEVRLDPSPGWESGRWNSLTYYPEDAARANKGAYPKEFLEAAPPIQASAKDFMRDKNNPTVMTPAILPLTYFSSIGQEVGTPKSDFKNIYGSNEEVMVINFGNFGPGVPDFGETVTSPPAGKIIYSSKSIAVFGNPTADVTIVSAKDIYVIGDFNQRGNTEKYGFPQNYKKHPKNYDADDYTYESATVENPQPSGVKYQMARLIANYRIIYDYRDLRKCFSNEMYPFLKYQIAKKIYDDDSADPAFAQMLKTTGVEKVEKSVTQTWTSTSTSTSTSTDTGTGDSEDTGGAGGTGGSGGNAEPEITLYAAASTDTSTTASEPTTKEEAMTKAREKILEKVKTYLTDTLKLNWDDFKTDLDELIKEDTSATSSGNSVTMKFSTDNGADRMNNVYKTAWSKVKIEASTTTTSEDEDNSDSTTTTTEYKGIESIYYDLIAKYNDVAGYTEGSSGGADKNDDYLYYPEMTTNGMFISFGKRYEKDSFYPGPDFAKHFCELGKTVKAMSFIHRMYGSESNFRQTTVPGTTAAKGYNQPIRKKLYDKTVHKKWTDSDAIGKMLDVPTYGILTWQEGNAAQGFNSF